MSDSARRATGTGTQRQECAAPPSRHMTEKGWLSFLTHGTISARDEGFDQKSTQPPVLKWSASTQESKPSLVRMGLCAIVTETGDR